MTGQTFIHVVGTFFAVLAALGGVVAYYRRQIDVLHSRINAAEKSLADFKVKVAEEYASHDLVKEIKRELISHMDSKFDMLTGLIRNGAARATTKGR